MAENQNTTKPSFVYACVSADRKYVKIGYSINPKNRIPQVRMQFRYRFKVESTCLGWHPGTLADEAAMQKALRGHETVGNMQDGKMAEDWFHGSEFVFDVLRSFGFEVPR